jgi:hypothetical protein
MTRNIVIAGSVAQRPASGGHTWVFLQYLLGFKRLGWKVLLVDRLEPDMCVDAAGAPCALEHSVNLAYFERVMNGFGLGQDYHLSYNHGERVIGRSHRDTLDFIASAELFINVMGFCDDRELLRRAGRKVFLDIDPGFGQMWRETGLHDLFAGHDAFVTIGLNIGREECSIPTCGLPWITSPQPVVLDQWPECPAPSDGRITSIATWRGPFGPVEYRGEIYGLRAHEFRRFAALPARIAQPFELALDIHPADVKDLALLRENQWGLIDPKSVAADPWTYRTYLQQSAAEFMIAKGMYVQTGSGWLSDRSLCYLASGKPVIAQDTGIAKHYPTGEGLVTFRTLDEASEACERVMRDHAHHARAARELAERYFDSDKVLASLLARLGVAA